MESIERSRITVGGLNVDVIRKDVKNLHLGVYPPSGRVRVAAPFTVSEEAIRLAVIGKLPWIRRQRERFARQSRQSKRHCVTGESHYVLGRRYRMTIVEAQGRPQVVLATKTRLELHVPRDYNTEQRQSLLDRWYRGKLRKIASECLGARQETLGVKASFVGIKRMKTKWGSCSPASGRVWLNSELAKKPVACIEYIVVHELIHFLEPSHGERFIALMDQHMPSWRRRREELNASPLAHEDWSY